MAQQRLVTKLEFSTRAGVSKPAISKALRGALRAALVGERINLDHPAAAEYLRAHGKATAKAAPARAPTKTRKRRPKSADAPTSSDDLVQDAPDEPTTRRPSADPPPRLKADE